MKPARFILLPLVFLAACASSRPEGAGGSALAAGAEPEIHYKVIPLRYAAAQELASTLRSALARPGAAAPAEIVADERTNSLLVVCDPDRLAPIQQMVVDLDVPAKKP